MVDNTHEPNYYRFRPYRYHGFVAIGGIIIAVLLCCESYIFWYNKNNSFVATSILFLILVFFSAISLVPYRTQVIFTSRSITIENEVGYTNSTISWQNYPRIYITSDWHGHQHLQLSGQNLSVKERKRIANKNGTGLNLHVGNDIDIPVNCIDIQRLQQLLENSESIIYN